MMMEKTCCFIGHKNLTQEQAIEALHLLIKSVISLLSIGITASKTRFLFLYLNEPII